MHYVVNALRVQVARMLLAIEQGRLHEFKGRSIDSIDLNGIISISCDILVSLVYMHLNQIKTIEGYLQ